MDCSLPIVHMLRCTVPSFTHPSSACLPLLVALYYCLPTTAFLACLALLGVHLHILSLFLEPRTRVLCCSIWAVGSILRARFREPRLPCWRLGCSLLPSTRFPPLLLTFHAIAELIPPPSYLHPLPGHPCHLACRANSSHGFVFARHAAFFFPIAARVCTDTH